MNVKEKIDLTVKNYKKKRNEAKRNKEIYKEREKYHKSVLEAEKRRDFSETNPHEDSFISLININKIYDNHVQAVYDFNLDIKEKEFIVLVGPSGCGKSTTLRMIAGLEDITSGDLYIDKVRCNDFDPKERNIAMVFQSYALYPHMNVFQNMSFGLKINHYPKEEIQERVTKAAQILQLTDYLDRKPGELSGGQCQRVALGRAIVRNSKLFLFDEPLSNLDAKLRVQMRSEIVRIHNSLDATSIYVTHDQTEAMTMASRIVVMNKGYVQQIGSPSEIYDKPSNLFVASFIGSPAMNIFESHIENDCVTLKNKFKINLKEGTCAKIKDFYSQRYQKLASIFKTRKEEFEELNSDLLTTLKMICEGNRNFKELNNKVETKKDAIQYLFNKFKCEKSFNENDDYERLESILFDNYIEKLSSVNQTIKTETKQYEKIKNIVSKNDFEILIGIRPEGIKINTTADEKYKVDIAELLGSEYMLHFDFLEAKEIVAKAETDFAIKPGDYFGLEINLNKLHIFDPITEERIEI